MKHIFLIQKEYSKYFKTPFIEFKNYENILKEINKINMLSSRIYIVGEKLWNFFINLSKRKNIVCSFIKTYCDCVENIKFNNCNVFLFDTTDTSILNIKILIKKLLIQPPWKPDGVHDNYVKTLYELGVVDE